MAAGITNQGQENMLNLLKNVTWPSSGAWGAALTEVWVGLFTTNPTSNAATSNGSTEVSGNAYARQGITSGSWTGPTASGTSYQLTNTNVITFPTPTPSGWGTIIGVGIFDASTSGNLLMWNSISSQAIGVGVVASFAANALVFNVE